MSSTMQPNWGLPWSQLRESVGGIWRTSLFRGLSSTILTTVKVFVTWVLRAGPMPKHIAIIMDGNRRFAERAGMDRIGGHVLGGDRLIETLENCFHLGVRYVSAYAFSIDNFGRSEDEVSGLMRLVEEKLDTLVTGESQLRDHGVCVRVVGDLSLLPASVRAAAERAMAATEENGAVVLNLCVAYTSTAEIVHSVQEIRDAIWEGAPCALDTLDCRADDKGSTRTGVESRQGLDTEAHSNCAVDRVSEPRNGAVACGDPGNADLRRRLGRAKVGADDESLSSQKGVVDDKMEPWTEAITVREIENHLYTAGCPPPDILIRTSGETRLSNFMLWQCSTFSRLSFCKVLWPAFGFWHLVLIILDYQRAYPALQEQRRQQESGGSYGLNSW